MHIFLSMMRTSRLSTAWIGFALVVASLFYVDFSIVHKTAYADDMYFSSALDNRGLFEFLRFRYETWSGRLPIEMATVIIIHHMLLWRAVNSLMMLLLCYSIGRIGFGRHLRWPAAVASVFALLMLVHFLDSRERSQLHKVVLIVVSGLGAYNEQIGFVLLGLAVPLLLRRIYSKSCSTWDVVYVAFVAANWMIAIAAPGMRVRYQDEQRTWFANFETLGVLDKINIGLELIGKFVINGQNLLVAVLVACAAVSLCSSPASRFARIGLYIGLAFIGLQFLLTLAIPPDSKVAVMYAFKSVGAMEAASSKAYEMMAFSMFAIACLVISTAHVFWRSGWEAIFVAWALLVGLASIAALGWSPTAHASGARIQFVCAIIFVAVTCRVIVAVKDEISPGFFKGAMILATSVAALRVLNPALIG
jgi:hypothetical protein